MTAICAVSQQSPVRHAGQAPSATGVRILREQGGAHTASRLASPTRVTPRMTRTGS